MQNPIPASQLNSLNALICPTPQVSSSLQICNGIPQNEGGLQELCPFQDFLFYTCVRVVHPFTFQIDVSDGVSIVWMSPARTNSAKSQPSPTDTGWWETKI
jgi:hypothetical protein